MKKYAILSLFILFYFINCIDVIKIESEQTNQTLPLYKVREYLKPKNLINISQDQIEQHWKLYKSYVDQVNQLNSQLAKLRAEGKGNTLDYADRRRRFGFEYNGMVLHEYYFENLKNTKEQPNKELVNGLEKSFGSYKVWQDDFIQAGKTRGIGWVILYLDPETNLLINVFVQDHEVGNIAGFKIILAMDVWEHAYMVDYQATQRLDYIDAFMKNINWGIVNKRFQNLTESA